MGDMFSPKQSGKTTFNTGVAAKAPKITNTVVKQGSNIKVNTAKKTRLLY